MTRNASLRVALAIALGLSTVGTSGCARQLTNRQVAYGVIIVGGVFLLGAASSGYHYSSAKSPPRPGY
ncbi:MAG TPA: hypothetical protein PLF40_13105 [Kofleriaceae bacterium]|nr:hypothetical protein [Kofleriaceae bacterium]